MNYTRYSRTITSTKAYFNYNYATIARTPTAFQEANAALTSGEKSTLNSQKMLWTITNGTLVGTKPAVDAKFWDVDAVNSSYTDGGAQTTYLERTNAGVEDIKVGGACLVWYSFTDGDGTQNAGDYFKWANAESAGAFSVSALAAVAAVVALF